MIQSKLREEYSPLYFLAALAAGGVATTFFVYLTFLIDHPDTPLVTFDRLWPVLTDGAPLAGALTGLAIAGLVFFSLLHFRLLAWNLVEYRRFRGSAAHHRLRSGAAGSTLSAIPMTLAMSVILLLLNAVSLVPGSWTYAEWMLAPALAILVVLSGLVAGNYLGTLGRIAQQPDEAPADGGGLGHTVSLSALALLAVELAVVGALSDWDGTRWLGIATAGLIGTTALGLGAFRAVASLRALLGRRAPAAASPAVWIMIPLLAVPGIAMHAWLAPGQPAQYNGLLLPSSLILALQVLFGLLGFRLMRRLGYFHDFLRGPQRHPGSYTLICPGVAFFVSGMFFLGQGLLSSELIDRYSLPFFAALAPLVYVQLKTLFTMLRLNERLLYRSTSP